MSAESQQKMGWYAVQQAAARLDRLAYEMARVRRSPDPDTVHDLRVSIRRFLSCLRVFRTFFPRGRTKKIRKRLREIMLLAGQVRDRDIAVELIQEGGMPAGSPVLTRLSEQRQQGAEELSRAVKHWKRGGFSDKWRTQLGL